MKILNSAEDISDLYGPSLNRALAELHTACGFAPRVLSPYGGLRTPAQQHQINPGVVYSDHVKGRAVDIDNQRAIRNTIGSARFEAILRKWGWKNQTTDGFPFPSEPWHFANHLNALQLAALGVKIIVTPKPKPPRKADPNVRIIYNTADDKYWRVGETTAVNISSKRALAEYKVWGQSAAIKLDGGETSLILDDIRIAAAVAD